MKEIPEGKSETPVRKVSDGILPYVNDFKGGGHPSSDNGTLEETSGLSVQQT